MSVNGLPDRTRFFEQTTGLVDSAARAAKATHPRVALCGERAGMLWAEGKVDAAILLEKFCNELSTIRELDILCAYPPRSEEQHSEFETVCAEHSCAHFPRT